MLALSVLCTLFACCAAASVPIVQTSSGLVSGKRFLVNNKSIDAFYGIPYAEPPVGELRFQRPRPARPWKGVLNATKKPVPCWQLDLRFLENVSLHYDKTSEDCLYLNVWRPSLPECQNLHCRAKLPVIVFVYGGAFQWGDSSLLIYDMEKFVSKSDVIFVTLNYRIGVFGFLTTNTEEAPANNGLWDQNLALKWVKRNIANFGGDHNDVTFAGQSAGGMSVSFHAISPHSRGLFNKMVMHSGTALSAILWRAQSSVAKMRNMAGVLGCYNATRFANEQAADTVACLKKLDAKVIMDAVRRQDPANQMFFPVLGDYFMPDDPEVAATWEAVNTQSVLLGTTQDEGTFFVDNLAYLSPQLAAVLKQDYRLAVMAFMATTYGIPFKEAKGMVAEYFGDYDVEHDDRSVFAIFSRVVADSLIDCPTQFLADLMSRRGIPTYKYVFAHRPSFTLWPEKFGVAHSDDITFFYGSNSLLADETKYTDAVDSQAREVLSSVVVTKEEQNFTDELMKLLYKFAKTGKPSSPRLVNSWPLYAAPKYQSLILRPNNFTTTSLPSRCDLWKPYMYHE
ncbi:hypothetical protein HPB50_005968 [Hyalomma asiaticum]|uniref:Uncharacterized protein n=1 Tax=Hyalomma asiaticum TaxID=266040 RepID=A0ACB7S6W0_HYAAI|nr:hypothetical protein HPB50_005968 [Hyalomma asiaticum]